MSLTAATRLCGVIGWPVGHSLSPAMHNAAYAHLGLPYAYAALPVRAGDVGAAIDGARALGFVGLNVTVPHKEEALRCCDADDLARAVGAVNTVCFDGATAVGTNTDVLGLERALEALGPDELRRAVIFGAGGAARAAAYVLDARGVAITVCARRARQLDVSGRRHPVVAVDDLGQSGLGELLAAADLVVDATPLGLRDDPTPWPISALRDEARVLDLVVRAHTPLERAARARGLRAAVGDVMLLHQGAAAFFRMTGVEAPLDVMRAALARALEAA